MNALGMLLCGCLVTLVGCESSEPNEAQLALADTSWYIARASGRVTDDGKPLNECVKSTQTPAEIMEGARTNGLKFTVTDDGKKPPQIVLINMVGAGKRVSVLATRGIIGCMQSKVITGIDVYDAAQYK